MAALIVVAVVVAAPMTAASRIEHWRPWIAEAALRFDVPQAWIVAVMRAESGGRTHLNGVPITSRAGAMGLMQLMPATYRELARLHGLGSDPYDPRDNILAGAAYLSAMRARFGYPGLFAAYNAGPVRYAAHLRTGAPLPAETQAYIETLAATRGEATLPPATLSGTRLFFRLQGQVAAGDPDIPPTPSAGLFVARSVQAPEGRR
jgi:soluble lytic murein transglycosylase-like protein